jgi:membrane-anchored protein YejM (alkaline phosphatase superfamily)
MNNGTDTASKADKVIREDMLNFLNTRDLNKPYFSFMIFDSVHDYNLPKDYEGPFQPAVENINYLTLNSNTDRTPYFNKHQNSVHYVDSLFKGLIDSPMMNDPKRPTVIVVTSDHGEQFNDFKKGFWGHNSNFSRYQLKVPFLIYWDGIKPKAKSATGPLSYSHLTTHMDLTHTFLESVFNCTPSKQQSTGANLYSEDTRFPLLVSNYSRHGIITEDKLFSYRIESGYEVFDHDYNELDDQTVPKEIYELYLEESTRFYN